MSNSNTIEGLPRTAVLILALLSLPSLVAILLLEAVEVLDLPLLVTVVGATVLGVFLIGYHRVARFDRESWS